MEGAFSVTLRGKQVGKVLVKKQGLYYSFCCRCDLCEDAIYRLTVICGTVRENLGILVPEDGSFVLETRKPVKMIGEGDCRFTLCTKQERTSDTFVPISPEEPFAYISRLKQSFLVLREGQPGIRITEMQEC